MLIFTKIPDIQAFLNKTKAVKHTVGFVPTMGALHEGHMSLISLSKQQCDVTVCSIFVNPTQFNDTLDLKRYPRTPEKDILMLEKAGCDVLFMPAVDEMYPTSQKETFDFGSLDKILEGEHRPGHFDGVAQVVKLFFGIINPHKAFFGSKDYQQVMIVRALVKMMDSPIEIVSCPILREPDGLAMSSRNALLGKDERAAAAAIPAVMAEAAETARKVGVTAAKALVKKRISEQPLLKLAYYEICESEEFAIVHEMYDKKPYVSLIAVFSGHIRLIDNLVIA